MDSSSSDTSDSDYELAAIAQVVGQEERAEREVKLLTKVLMFPQSSLHWLGTVQKPSRSFNEILAGQVLSIC